MIALTFVQTISVPVSNYGELVVVLAGGLGNAIAVQPDSNMPEDWVRAVEIWPVILSGTGEPLLVGEGVSVPPGGFGLAIANQFTLEGFAYRVPQWAFPTDLQIYTGNAPTTGGSGETEMTTFAVIDSDGTFLVGRGIASTSRIATGRYLVVLQNAVPGALYGVNATASLTGASPLTTEYVSKTSSQVEIRTRSAGSANLVNADQLTVEILL